MLLRSPVEKLVYIPHRFHSFEQGVLGMEQYWRISESEKAAKDGVLSSSATIDFKTSEAV